MQVIRLLSLCLLSGLLACQKPDTLPAKPDTGAHAGDSIVVTPPANATTTPPLDSVNTVKKLKISWSINDFQEVLYNSMGQPVQYTSQYVDNQGTGHIRWYIHKLRYNAEKQLTKMDVISEAGNSYATYQYSGNQVSQTSLYTADGRLLSTCTYQYAAPNQLRQVDETHVFSNTAERRTYQYDARGNLTVLTTYAKEVATETYVLQHTLFFSEYDTQRDVESLLFHVPLLPNVTFRTNNHGLKILRDPTGRELSRERTTYEYNEQGYPIQQTRTGPGGSLTARYSY